MSVAFGQRPLPIPLNPEELASREGYTPLRPGVDILRLYENPETGATSALLRYQPGAQVPEHRHAGVEHVFILSGEQADERGRYPAGTLLINTPGSTHRVWSESGCLVLVVWERPVQFL